MYPSEEDTKTQWYLNTILLFGLSWIIVFIKSNNSFVTQVAATTYYFDSDRQHEGQANMTIGFKFTYMYHAGSLALGSLLIAVTETIRGSLLKVAETMERTTGNVPCFVAVACCGNQCLSWFEKYLDYINGQAFAYIAVSGDPYCESAMNNWLINLKYTFKFGYANFFGSMLTNLGKFCVTLLNCLSCIFVMKYVTGEIVNVETVIPPLLVVGTFTYLTISLFLSVFDETILAMLTCLAIDMDLHSGQPKYGPPVLHNIFKHHGVFTDQSEDKKK